MATGMQMTLDEMVCEHGRLEILADQHPRRSALRTGGPMFAAIIGFLVFPCWLILGVMGVAIVDMFYGLYWDTKISRIRWSIYESLYGALETVPFELVEAAMKIAPDSLTARLWALECHEAHLPGDCPLCGAD